MRLILILCFVLLAFWIANFIFGNFFAQGIKRKAFYFFVLTLGLLFFIIVFKLLSGFFGVAIPMSMLLLFALWRRGK